MTAIDFTAFVDELATVSGETIRPFFRSALGVENKSRSGGFDPVTAADRAAEAAMRALIKRTFPEHGVVGEELDADNPDAEYVWVLDPIDGTKSFICGMPAWGTLIALTRRGEPIYGMMHQPFTRERYCGDGKRSHWRGLALPRGEGAHSEWVTRALHVRACPSLAEATLMTTSPLLFNDEDRAAYHRVEKATRLARYGGDCYAYCMLASGFVDVIVEANLKPYDIVALVPIIEGAGGIVTNWEGDAAAKGGRILAAGDRRLHEEAMRRLAG